MRKRILAWLLAGLFGVEAATVAVVQIASWVRKLGRPEASIPRLELAPLVVGKSRVRLYVYGQDLYQDMLQTIKSARESLFLETFIWKADEVGRKFKEQLAERAFQGVDVRVVYDEFGNLVVPARFKRFPRKMNVLGYRGFNRPWHVLDPRRYALEHRKVLVVDGQTAYLGGYNIGAPYATKWRDTHIRIDGPAAADLADQFSAFWNAHRREQTPVPRRYPRQFNPLIRFEGNDAMRLTFPIRDMYIRALDNAEHIIRLTNAYFVPDSALLSSLMNASRRGVDVRLLVPWISNHVLADWLARGMFEDLLRANVRIFGYESMLHAKTCTIDGQWSTIGTANMDRLSAVGNYEINVEIYSEAVARQMDEIFDRDCEHAREITLAEWLARPGYAKLGERIIAPLRTVL